MNCAIHGVVHACPHCVSSERDHLIQNEWLYIQTKIIKMCQIQSSISATS
jgi:hypothetical protein